jgi:hypothetical protein
MPICSEGLAMYKRSLIFTALALAMACKCAPSLANELPTSDTTDQHVAPGIHEVDDDELANMRGRYTVGDNTVVYFGVEMVSTWHTDTGQVLQSAVTVEMNFGKNHNQPQVTFVPTVTITTTDAPLPTSTIPSTINRSVQSGGIANVGGLTQSVQLAGDGNAASNVTSLNIQNENSTPSSNNGNNTSTTSPDISPSSSGASVAVTSPTTNTSSSTTSPASGNSGSSNNVASTNTSSSTTPSTTTTTGASTSTGRTATVGNATASATYSNNSAEVSLSITGQGNVSQWIHAGSLGQTIALTTDNQVVTNQMIVSLVTQSIASTTSQVAHSLAQSMNFSHTTGH